MNADPAVAAAQHSPHAPAAQAERAPARFVTAASLFDGHDAAINMIRRLLQAQGAEVVHLGHNRSVDEIVRAALQEDADAIAVSSYQGGHVEYFTYMVDRLRECGLGHVKLFVGGGGTIAPGELQLLERHGVEKIYTPEDGRRLGLTGMIEDVMARTRAAVKPAFEPRVCGARDHLMIARSITVLERDPDSKQAGELRRRVRQQAGEPSGDVPVIGITGPGGAGKSSLTDELLARFQARFPDRQIAVVAIDPTRRRSGGALLGDRIRMNSLSEAIFMRSLATRRAHRATSAVLAPVIDLYRACGFDLILVETAGTGQSDTEVSDLVDLSLYVMTSEYGAASQLEKIDMLDFADFVVLNKSEKRGSEDALRDVRKQWRRNHQGHAARPDSELPVFPTIASRFNDAGVNRLFAAICAGLAGRAGGSAWQLEQPAAAAGELPPLKALIPAERERYLAEIAARGRETRERIALQVDAAHRACSFYQALNALGDPALPAPFEPFPGLIEDSGADASQRSLRAAYNQALGEVGADALRELARWPERARAASANTFSYTVRGRAVTGDNYTVSLAGSRIPKLALPEDPADQAGQPDKSIKSGKDWGEQLRFLLNENLPGSYPYTCGVFPYRREEEDPIRMFAGEGGPERTNRRFHYLAAGQSAVRLSTAFDSTTLYGEDPDTRPDIYGRTGNSGVSVATLDDMKKLYSGFDLCAPSTSVSMTINGPAPMILAMFMNAAIDQQVERHLRSSAGWERARLKIEALHREARERGAAQPVYAGDLPPGHDGTGLALLGVSGSQLVGADVYGRIKADTLARVRGTVQADILKEDQAQNTCIFSTELALRMMGDVQEYFITHGVKGFYSVSVSGYHIAEAGANPITQLAFTLANGFTLVEYFLARGMRIDDFAPSLSFFFSSGMDPEYAVIGRVARRIWARALAEVYHAAPRSQMLKYHIQTSGRSLHAREIAFNDVRTTLQALQALLDNCNSLHTNAYDEALTTPTEESVRRAVAIQLIINRELGLNKIQNLWSGSYALEHLTGQVEEAVYRELESIASRGGVLAAMETMYQRMKIQEESMVYEQAKHDGSLPIIGVNTFLSDQDAAQEHREDRLIRASDAEKEAQVAGVRAFQARHRDEAPAALARLTQIAARGENVFDALMDCVRCCSLGQISAALYRVGGRYRRSM